MIRINILDLNSRHPLLPVPADWFPLFINKQMLRDFGISFSVFTQLTNEFYNCDIAFVSSRYFHLQNKSLTEKDSIFATLSSIKNKCGCLFWFDFRDSTGCTQFEVMPYVDKYLKKQLLIDKSIYSRSLYGNRIYADFIHHKFSINDAYEEPGIPLQKKYEHKLAISWNPGLLDFRGGTKPALLFHLLTDKLSSRSSITPHFFWHSPSSPRPINMLAVFNTKYDRSTVAWQRMKVTQFLQRINDPSIIYNRKLSLSKEISIRRSSKIVLSLFGWGEICSRDFHTFIAGAALIAPDSSHLDTWPQTHIPYETYYPIKWDLSDLPNTYHNLIENDNLRLKIAVTGQELYKHLWSPEGRQSFCLRLQNLIHQVPASSSQVAG